MKASISLLIGAVAAFHTAFAGPALTIYNQDFAVVRAMVFLGSVLYIIGLILTDISYTLVDPRIRLA